MAGSGSLVVRAHGGISSPFAFAIQTFAPAIFFNGTAGDQTGLAKIIRDDNGELVDFTNPPHPRLPFRVSVSWTKSIAATLRHTGRMERPPAGPRGPRSKLTPEVQKQMRAWIAAQPDLTLAEIQRYLHRD